MLTSDFDYSINNDLIAQTPTEPRDHSRLLILDRSTGKLEHRRFYEIGDFLESGDLLVLNNSRVIPARLTGKRTETSGAVEILLLHRLSPGIWKALVKPGRRLKPGATIEIYGTECTILEDTGQGTRIIRISDENVIKNDGEIPLPPYIKTPLANQERYQTVYSKTEGSSAAPTAGLHFTSELLNDLNKKGIDTTEVTLHVGLDSFRPVKSENPNNHVLHSEYFEIGEDSAVKINQAHTNNRRVISVGTTTVRVLEQAALHVTANSDKEDSHTNTLLAPVSAWANIFILPGHKFRLVNGLITNFHLPRSTLLMLVCAFAGRDTTITAYNHAVNQGYRLYSFGDAMLIL